MSATSMKLIFGVIAVLLVGVFALTVAFSPSSVETLRAQNASQAKLIKQLERADRAISAGCEEARTRSIPIIAALETLEANQLLLEDQLSVETKALTIAEELSYWMKYCVPKGYVLHQRLVGAVQKGDLRTVRESLAQFRSGAVIVERNAP